MPPRNLSLVPPATPDQHISVEQLRQYAAGTLLPAQQHLVEAHTIDCAYCGEILDGLSVTDYPTTESALRTVQGRLHARLAIDTARHSHRYAAWAGVAATLLLLTVAASVFWLNLQHPPRRLNRGAGPTAAAPHAAPQAAPAATAPAPAQVPPGPTRPAASAARATSVAATAAAATGSAPSSETYRPPTRPASGVAAAPVAIRVATSAPTAAPVFSGLSSSSATLAAAPAPGASATVSNADVTSLPATTTEPIVAMAPRTSQGLDAGALPTPMLAAVPAVVLASTEAPSEAAEVAISADKARASSSPAPAPARPAASTEGRSTMQMPPSPDLASVPSGGHAAFRRYLKKELQFPEADRAKGVEGVVKLRFVVAVDGSLQDIKVVSPVSEACDAEAIRLLKEGPAWYPAIVRGKRVPTVMRVSVTFNPLE